MIHFISAAPYCIATRKLECFTEETCHRDLFIENAGEGFVFANIQLLLAYSFLNFDTVMPSLVLYSETGKFLQKMFKSYKINTAFWCRTRLFLVMEINLNEADFDHMLGNRC